MNKLLSILLWPITFPFKWAKEDQGFDLQRHIDRECYLPMDDDECQYGEGQ